MSHFDQESIVYGVIRHAPDTDEFTARLQKKANWSAIQNLPLGADDEWAFLCREMFAMPGDHLLTGTFHTQVIHFAASYRAVEYEWENWIRHFESLLKNTYWISATVHLETELSGKHTFNWETENVHAPSDDDLRMSCEWEREVGLAI